ncbi:hypothetical protein [Paraburkholderia azotifigens]|jgi:hypothetical protein|uniref:hypothetical protein n=1 Tax=Paraburkholderia azotifigens TaxID=2057004 RepID=UPI0038B84BDF
MNTARIGTLALQTRLALSRLGWSRFVVVLLCVAGAACWLAWIPARHADANAQAKAIERQRMALRAPRAARRETPASPAQANLMAFYGTLGNRQHAERQIGTLFELARKSGLVLSKGDYTWAYDRTSQVYAYQVLLPVAGPYSAVRRFCERVLLTIPFASLDEITFKREAVGNGSLDARLRFTLYLTDAPTVHVAPETLAMEVKSP